MKYASPPTKGGVGGSSGDSGSASGGVGCRDTGTCIKGNIVRCFTLHKGRATKSNEKVFREGS